MLDNIYKLSKSSLIMKRGMRSRNKSKKITRAVETKPRHNKIHILIILLAALSALVVFFIGVGIVIQFTQTALPSIIGNAVQTGLTASNLPEFLQNQQIIRDLPDDARISLQLYSFSSGQRQWENSYSITKGKVVQGKMDNPDIVIWIHMKYLPEFGNFCSAVKKARANNDLGTYSDLSMAKLLWKYKTMLKYKDCLGF
jgi:hypothetical protein